MQFTFQACLISTSTSIDDGRIVANARIFTPASDGSFEDDVHELCLDESFIDENEALAFARARAMGWIEEHYVSGMSFARVSLCDNALADLVSSNAVRNSGWIFASRYLALLSLLPLGKGTRNFSVG